MRQSMTGFASGQGSFGAVNWAWEMRGVNGKGLEIRFRLPDWVPGLEPKLKAVAQGQLARGNIQIGLRAQSAAEEGSVTLNEAHLQAVLNAMAHIETDAMEAGLSLAPSTAADIAALRGILETRVSETDTDALAGALVTDFQDLVAAFAQMRAAEGAALQDVLSGQLAEIDRLVSEAEAVLARRSHEQAERLRAALSKVVDSVAEADPQRVAQELALIAVKADVTEEIDRLRAHIKAAGDLLAQEGPVGRKLDFLMQEFNREANTLCSKSGSTELTQVGLALKTVIDQMREQVQNVE